MSDDASPNSTAPNDVSPAEPANASSGSRVTWDLPQEQSRSTRSRAQSQSQRRKKKKNRKKRNPGLARKLLFVTHLLKSLDTLVFAELSALYYMECSMFRFILRAVGQYLYLTPKDESFPFLMPASPLHVCLVLIPNIICILLHIFVSLPVGPDFHRGYMHGGLVIDFIGQKPPTSRVYYVLADVMILAVQCFMLTVHTERERLRVILKTFRPMVPDVAQEMAPTIEDLDAEERGVSRDMPGSLPVDEEEGIEMQPLHRVSTNEEGNSTSGESEPSGRERSVDEPSRSHLSDVLSSGNAIIGEYHILHSLHNAALNIERTAAYSLRTISYGATMASIEARRRALQVPVRTVQNDRQQ
ncbi:uncharacterized protein B0J16DRAFT_328212 [Fusarium flagelliforme]|uniref:Duf1746-domain-containing protein n=1 Tax=Fusarium flagelliforme TaxID=2675880 RepID=A0A395N3W9_9HYPO|nr:uncharacterized protein B0J16DRAFT_328212 [Fusarium flagelliforme]KAH7197443.1 hypothetical protein B0J16DRAFT_328212 [Fusarium flagelliforme]RFN54822.1 duf1746-domain-containing protein [Fusarium flagelliforme]